MNIIKGITISFLGVLLLAACGGVSSGSVDESVSSQSSTGANSLQVILERGVLRVGTTGDFFMSFIVERSMIAVVG